ncbi:MAG TPA: winged helix-turn-helix domain-containing protein [Acidimicrobiia bacterium]|nr:winged helix-turn-helix domain-containing protein [Acidimicrobiia bacterium]
MWFGVLGPLMVKTDAGEVEVGPRQRRVLLCRLLVDANRVVSSDLLIDALWGDDPPLGAAASLQAHISRLRTLLGGGVLVTRAPGYVLNVADDSFDVAQFQRLSLEGRQAAASSQIDQAADRLAQGLGLWRGEAYTGFDDSGFARAEAADLALGAFDRAAVLIGSIDRLAESGDIGDFVARHDQLKAEAEKRLDSDKLEAALARGRHMDPDGVHRLITQPADPPSY